ncbi:hypothetical protein C8F04DRAFT_1117104 [Mycena alexandri]|uniref:Uncharacterized protein n=1 Tax=Mycena alexandri TaxID=1745969 RepID=A0AAD6SJN6_9AGAR|nr:hypothetical protein C8F04DRAFT_1117104 [Mycena alexandri]
MPLMSFGHFIPHHPLLPRLSLSSLTHSSMATTIGVSTKIWERNQHWSLYSQCAVWDPSTRSVHVWECIRARASRRSLPNFLLTVLLDDSVPGTEPPNVIYWRFIGRR